MFVLRTRIVGTLINSNYMTKTVLCSKLVILYTLEKVRDLLRVGSGSNLLP